MKSFTSIALIAALAASASAVNIRVSQEGSTEVVVPTTGEGEIIPDSHEEEHEEMEYGEESTEPAFYAAMEFKWGVVDALEHVAHDYLYIMP